MGLGNAKEQSGVGSDGIAEVHNLRTLVGVAHPGLGCVFPDPWGLNLTTPPLMRVTHPGVGRVFPEPWGMNLTPPPLWWAWHILGT
eukprot:365295-Chlamydomonas_euryale.AAC.4